MSKLEYTSSSAIEEGYQQISTGFHSGILQSHDFRRGQLRNLYYGLLDNEQELKEALVSDLHRSHNETELLELNEIFTEIVLAIKNLDEWAKDKKISPTEDVRYALGKSVLRKTPYGVVLIIGPWNYPYLCTVLPIISAIAAGNSVMVKPTEMAPESTRVLTRVLESVLDPRVLRVTVGAVTETTQLLEYKWDKIMLTGSGRVGKIVAHAAAEKLTPICLELGGKSPVIVTRNANLKLAARRIAWAKFVNAGQTCIAPDYVIVDREVKAEFLRFLKEAVKKLYPDISTANSEARDFGHIIADRLFDRALEIVQSSSGTEKWHWGTPNRDNLFFPPTIISGGVTVDDSTMAEELFNPILPIIEVEDPVQESHKLVKTYHDYPLALYIFSNNKKEQEILLSETRSGSVMINDAVMYGGSPAIPFGGVGHSGIGRYHGKYGFDEFTHERPVIETPTWAEKLIAARYPPYTASNARALKLLSRPHRAPFARTGPVKGQSFLPWLLHLIIRKFGFTLVVLAIIYHFR